MTLRAFVLSLILHAVMGALLVFSFDFSKEELVVQPEAVMQAVSVDSTQVEKEISRLREIDQKKERAEKKKQQDLEQKVRELEAKARAAERQSDAEEKRLAELSEKKEQERKEADAEEKRLTELKQQKQELEKKKQAEEDARKKEEAEAASKRKQAEVKKANESAQAAKDKGVVNEFVGRIKQSVQANYYLVKTDFPEGLECTLNIRLTPSGEVISVSVKRSSGNSAFDDRAKSAVYGASPLPVPNEARIFEANFRDIDFVFNP